MEIEFLKMQGCGEDVVVVDAPRIPAAAHARLPAIAARMLDRGTGVGGRSLVVLDQGDDALAVRCMDSAGAETPLSCNALRCAARYATDSGKAAPGTFCVTAAGRTQRVQIIDSMNVRVDMGHATSPETDALVRESNRDSFTKSIELAHRTLSYTPIALTAPCAVFFVPDFAFPIRRTAREIESHPDFPEGTGIGFLQVVSREQMNLRSWGGSGDECACAAAALVAAVVSGFTEREVFVRLRGGTIFVQWEEADNRIWVTGPAAYVFTGTYDDPEEDQEKEG
jgi:diaminopimelate epimerase